MLSFLIVPFFACIALVGVHVFFGVHVLKRGVLFVDLALAQWAALGYLIVKSLHIHNAVVEYAIVGTFPIFAALLLSGAKSKLKQVNYQEAFIGILYISASAFSIMLITLLGMEKHHLSEMLTGHLLFISLKEFFISTLLYVVIGLVMIVAHKKYCESKAFLSDLFFYSCFAIVVTSSVKLAGVILVFSLLVIPAFIAGLFTKSEGAQLVMAWLIGSLGCVAGLGVVSVIDIQFSVAIIISLTAVLPFVLALKSLRRF